MSQEIRRDPPTSVWTPSFALLCSAMCLTYAHEGLLTPTIPLYVQSMTGSTAVVGFVLALFSLLSFAIRPFIGQWADRVNPRLILCLGALCIGLCDLGLLLPMLGVVCAISALRGVAWAATNTGGNTMLAHLAPRTRRAESASYYSLFQSTAIALVPSAALWILKGKGPSGYPLVFLLAAGCGLAAALLARGIPGTIKRAIGPSTPGRTNRGIDWAFLYDRGVLFPAVLLALMNLTAPAATAFIPLYLEHAGIDLGLVFWYFVARACGVVVAQTTLGRMFDRIGRGPATVLGLSLVISGFLFLLVPSNIVMIIVGGVATAVGQSIGVVNTTALAIDRSNPERVGSAMASFTLAFQVGQGAGSAFSGVIVQLAGFQTMYLSMVGALSLALALVVARWKSLRPELVT